MRYFLLFLIAAFVLVNCGGSDTRNQEAKLLGNWNITAMAGNHTLEACEQSMNFNFTNEPAEVAGRSGYLLKVTQGDNPCDMIGPNDDYETAYTFVDGQLFIKNLRLTGGDNWSGAMTIQSFTDEQLVVEILNTTFTFQKAS